MLQGKIFRCFLFSSLFAFSLYSDDDTGQEQVHECNGGPKPFRVTMKHIEGGGIGYNQGYSTLEGFFSMNKYRIVPFIDVRGHVFNDGKYAANAGLGIRGLLQHVAVGLNTYYDYRNTHHQHYNQIGVGLEALSAKWEGRINGYLPIGRKKSNPFDKRITETSSSITSISGTPSFGSFSGNNMILSGVTQTTTTTTTTRKKERIEFAMKGVDAEVGYHFFRKKNFDLFAGIGPYYFKGYFDKKAVGGKARLTATFTEYFYVTGIYSNDSLFHSRVQGEMGINIPFGRRKRIRTSASCKTSLALNERLVQPVQRQEIIVVNRHRRTSLSTSTAQTTTTSVVATNPNTGMPWNFIFVNNTSHSHGTFESPYRELREAERNSNPFDIIYVLPGDGTSTGLDREFKMKNNQKLWGAALPYDLETAEGSVRIPEFARTAPVLERASREGAGPIVIAANNTEIAGLHLVTGNNTDGIRVENIHNVFIHDNTLNVTTNTNGSKSRGIIFETSSGNINISRNIFNLKNDTSVGDSSLTFGLSINSTEPTATYIIDSNQFASPLDSDVHAIALGETQLFGQFDTVTISRNLFSGLGNSGTILPAIGGMGFEGLGRLIMDSNTFTQTNSTSSPIVFLDIKTGLFGEGAPFLAFVTNNRWVNSVSPFDNNSFKMKTTASNACLTLTGNSSDVVVLAYFLQGDGVSRFTVNQSNNTGPLIGSSTTPGTCPD